jgi:hypothetical protein
MEPSQSKKQRYKEENKATQNQDLTPKNYGKV